MAENVMSAVVAEVVGTAASFIRNKFDERSGISDKVERLEWKLLKIRSAIEESKKYDIDNEPLREMQQKFINVAQEGEDVLRNFNNQSNAPDPQSSVQDVMPSNLTISLVWKMLTYGLVGLHFLTHPHHLVDEFMDRMQIYTIYEVIVTLQKIDSMSNDVGEFLEMIRQQKRKRERRRRYRPYQMLLQAHIRLLSSATWMRLLFMGMSSPAYTESKLKGADASISAVLKVLLDVVSFSRKSLLLVLTPPLSVTRISCFSIFSFN